MAHPPGPKLPALVQSLLWLARPIDVMESCARRFGDAFTLNWVGVGRVVFISDPALIKEVFLGDPNVLYGGEGNAIVEPLLGKSSLFVLDGPAHLRQRRLLLPPFHGERMQKYAAAIREVADGAVDRWREGRAFSLHGEAQAITLEVIARTVFGVEGRAHLDGLLGVLGELIAFVGSRASDLFTLVPSSEAQRLLQIDLGPLSPWGRFLRLRAAVDDAIYAEIGRRRGAGASGDSVLSLLLSARDEAGEPMRDVELRDELMTLLIAGHETTAGGLAWAFESLLSTPGVEPRLAEELARTAPGGRLTAQGLAQMTYLDAVIKEALRLRPILQIVARRLKKPLRVGAWALPAETVVAPCIYLAQRRSESFPDPARFDPDRFVDGKPGPYAFLPFGGGIRKCIGAAFALYQMKVVAATILTRARLRLASKVGRVARRTVTLVPAGGTMVIAESVRPRAARQADASVAG